MPKDTPRSQKLATIALILGVAIGAGFYYLFRNVDWMPWWVSVIVGLSATGAGYSQLLRDEANKRIVDRQ